MGHYETPQHNARLDAQGRGQRVSKRLKGSSSQTAKQIPWAEIFNRHISLIEGHLKMTEMIKKHTVERSANWETICSLIDQTKEILRKTKTQSLIFMPHSNPREKVPLGSSSPSNHPEYLSNSHEQGSAADEHEQPASPAITRGADHKRTRFDDDPRQEISAKRMKLGDTSPDIASVEGSSIRGSDSGLDGPVAISPKPTTPDDEEQGQGVGSSTTRGANDDATFEQQDRSSIFDVNSTLVNPTGIAIKPRKRGSSIDHNHEGRKTKKSKTRHTDDEQPSSPAKPKVEFEDISQEVDARLREKEEKRKRKEKKRKKIADLDSNVTAPDANTTAEGPARLKKKKKVRHNDDSTKEAYEIKKKSGAESDEGQGERRKKRHKKDREVRDS